MHTEAEAKTKWCPEWRKALRSGGHPSSSGGGNEQRNCIASACMHWRWAEEASCIEKPGKPGEFVDMPRLGYCGLSGRPR